MTLSPDVQPRSSRVWIRAALLAGAAYLAIGRVPVPNVRAWRLAAWVASAVVFVAHIGYEHVRLRHSPRSTAWHTALGVATGAFALAVAAALHSYAGGTGLKPLWLLALVAWPLLTAVPAFAVVFVATAVFARANDRVPL